MERISEFYLVRISRHVVSSIEVLFFLVKSLLPLVEFIQADQILAILRNADLVDFEERYCIDNMLTVSIIIWLCKNNDVFTGYNSPIVPSPENHHIDSNQIDGKQKQAMH